MMDEKELVEAIKALPELLEDYGFQPDQLTLETSINLAKQLASYLDDPPKLTANPREKSVIIKVINENSETKFSVNADIIEVKSGAGNLVLHYVNQIPEEHLKDMLKTE